MFSLVNCILRFQVDTEFHLHKISEEVHNARKAEILYALLKMGAELSREEEDFLSNYSKIPSANFELTSEQKICNESLLNVILGDDYYVNK
uniref:Beta-catenin-interacting ICAT domain-containing protein n=1 Tax=Parascaris equorum TaxID=6256 RepID=A0A914RV18_PAREQ